MKKFIRMIAIVLVAIFCLQTVAFADSGGDPNIDNGGGGLKDGSSENFWNPGNDGVRVTVVDSETGAVKSASIDYTNKNVSDIALHFGKVSKAEYVGGTAISATTSGQIKTVVNNVVFPIIDLVLAVFFFAKLGLAYFDYRKSGHFEWAAPAILFACLVFTLTAPMYVWTIINI